MPGFCRLGLLSRVSPLPSPVYRNRRYTACFLYLTSTLPYTSEFRPKLVSVNPVRSFEYPSFYQSLTRVVPKSTGEGGTRFVDHNPPRKTMLTPSCPERILRRVPLSLVFPLHTTIPPVSPLFPLDTKNRGVLRHPSSQTRATVLPGRAFILAGENMRKLLIAITIVVVGTVAFAEKSHAPKFDSEKIRAHVKFLASDELEGRGMNQKGGDLAADYIAAQFKIYGLKPAGENGTYFQNVPMVGVSTLPASTFALVPDSGGQLNLKSSRRLRHHQRSPDRVRRYRRTHRLRRLRHLCSGIPVGRLQGLRHQGQGRSPVRQRTHLRRSEILQGQSTHLLRPLDL